MPRLNLRTLLDYLDDALEPAQAKLIGQRISENPQAQELIERIKQVTRRRRLANAPETAKIDPNTIAEYLDNTLSAEQQVELEQICLASDAHLAEMAACHQIMANKGEPVLVPPTAKQRMYRLTKDPSAPGADGNGEAESPEASTGNGDKGFALEALVDKGKRYKSHVLLGAGLLGGVLLAVAISQLLQLGGGPPRPEPLAKNTEQPKEKDTEKKEPVVPPKKSVEPEVKKQPDKLPEKIDNKLPTPKPPDEKVEPKPIEPTPKRIEPAPVDVGFPPLEPPTTASAMIGAFLPVMNQPTILLQAGDQKDSWHRLEVTKPEVLSARPLVSFPGCRSVVALQGGVRLTLWGNLSEMLPIPIQESLVEIHQQPRLDVDLTLKRGRIVLANLHEDRAALVRVRFSNPTNPATKEYMDIKLLQKGAEVLIDRFSRFSINEKFYADPKNPNRAGPVADMGVVVMNGDIELKFGDVTFGMQAPPGRAMLMWNSQSGLGGVNTFDKLPDFVSTTPPLYKGMDGKARNEMQRARDELSTSLSGKPLEVGLMEARLSNDAAKRQLAVRCYGAVDDVRSLLDAMEDKQAGVRAEAILTSRHWIAAERDNDYVFFDTLKAKYTASEAEKIMDLLHNVTERQLSMPETYEFLIESLDNPRLIFRELSRWHLYAMVPAGRNIPYAADADAAIRQKAQTAWRQLIPPGSTPKKQ